MAWKAISEAIGVNASGRSRTALTQPVYFAGRKKRSESRGCNANTFSMAHRLLIRRLWNFTVKDFHCLSASTATSSSFPVILQSTKNGVFFLSASHPITLMSHRRASFNVQDKEDFTERVINSQLPVLIDFHAQWCGPCKILGPRLEKAIARQKGRVAMAKVDIDDHTDLAIEYGVSAVPTVIGMRGGDVIGQFVGLKDDDELDSFVSQIIGQ